MTSTPIAKTTLDNVPFAFFEALVCWAAEHNSIEGKSYVHISAEYSESGEAYDLEIFEYFDDKAFNGFLPRIPKKIDKKIYQEID